MVDKTEQFGRQNVNFCKLGTEQLSLTAQDELSWNLLVSQQCIDKETCPLLVNLPSTLTSVMKVLLALDQSVLGVGNSDENLQY